MRNGALEFTDRATDSGGTYREHHVGNPSDTTVPIAVYLFQYTFHVRLWRLAYPVSVSGCNSVDPQDISHLYVDKEDVYKTRKLDARTRHTIALGVRVVDVRRSFIHRVYAERLWSDTERRCSP